MIDKFTAEYHFLSNFYPAAVMMDGARYPTVEHAYQAAKTLDEVRRHAIRNTPAAKNARYLGRRLRLRDDWEEVKIPIMTDLVRQKFMIPNLRRSLILTMGHELVEGNAWHDTFWGVCDGKGENHLGKILMQIREELLNGN